MCSIAPISDDVGIGTMGSYLCIQTYIVRMYSIPLAYTG